MTDGFRIVIGNEPRYYRDALAEALRYLHPDLEIVLTEPAGLDEEVARGGTQVVVCSRLSPAILDKALAWILLYPDAENRAVVSLAGQERSTPGFEIADILAVIEEARKLAQRLADDDGAEPNPSDSADDDGAEPDASDSTCPPDETDNAT
jgi:hypothetical protein